MELTIRPTKFVSVNQCYRHAKGRLYMTAEGKRFKEEVLNQLREQVSSEPTKEPVRLSLQLTFPDKRRRDIDNYNKLLFDACNGILWDDDSQIIALYIEKKFERHTSLITMLVEV